MRYTLHLRIVLLHCRLSPSVLLAVAFFNNRINHVVGWFREPFEGDADFQYLALDRKKLMEEAPPFDAKTSCWIVDQKEGYAKANIKATKGDDVTVITESLEVGV